MSIAKPIRFVASAWLGAVLLWAPASFASEGYPEIVADTLGMSCVPTCLLCHTSLQGGIGMIHKPPVGSTTQTFVLAMQGQGLQFASPQTVAPALMSLEAIMPPQDSDGDMMPDIAELRAGRDPNEAGEGNVCGGGPTYGCGARIARERSAEPIALGAALVTGLMLVLARRRRRP